MHRKLLETSGARLRRELGDVGVSVVRDAKVLVGALPDIGFGHGFIPIGTLHLPTASGTRVGAVSVKAPKGTGDAYPAAFARALARCREA